MQNSIPITANMATDCTIKAQKISNLNGKFTKRKERTQWRQIKNVNFWALVGNNIYSVEKIYPV